MPRPVLIEKTEAEIVVENTSKVFRPQSIRTGVVPPTFDGKHVLLCFVVVDVDPNEAQMDQFEIDIEAITGVFKAFIEIEGRIPLDRVPVDHDLRIQGEIGFVIDPTPAP